MEKNNLPFGLEHFITEDIYVFEKSASSTPVQENEKEPVQEEREAISPSSEPGKKEEIQTLSLFKGENKEGILFILDKPAMDEELSLLEKMIKACQLDLKKAGIVVLKEDQALSSWEALPGFKKLVYFTSSLPIQLIKEARFYKTFTQENREILVVEALSLYVNQTEKKKELWEFFVESFKI